MTAPGRATARACANIALVKYWGKRDAEHNLPAAPSLSLTLGALTTTTAVAFDPLLAADELVLDGRPAPAGRVSAVLDLVRARAGIDTRAHVTSVNDFPTASGLASSASAFAALAVAAAAAAGLDLPAADLSALARRGSGSAARSIFGGFVEMGDEFARPIDDATDWPVRMVIAVVGGGAAKPVSSRDAMTHCAETSPLYRAWLACVPGDLAAARDAIAARDLDALGRVAQASAMAMHAAALASRPSIRYWRPETLALLDAVDAIDGAYYTIDAGPHVKVLTSADRAESVAAALRAVQGVSHVLVSGPGGPARVVSTR
ncbi:MAG: diphosphomevalonate decarboxylase [Deltaproteobacteria bacterium]|nr:MAG: diphosphomevalonate decarboxylase [Deltaproteobacteria bacterium]